MRTLSTFLAVMFAAAPLQAQAPCHAENDTPTFNNGTSMGGPNLLLAVQFSPTSSFNAKRIEVFTGEQTGTNTVAIWSHDAGGNKPSAILSQGSFAMSTTNSWQGADLTSSVSLSAGTTYWMVWGCINGSQAAVEPPQATVGQVYRGSFDGGSSWNGPFQFATSHWKFRIYGDCISCAGFFQAYASGCPGGGGTPVLGGQGCPSGGQPITITVLNGPASASGLLFLGSGNGSAPVTPGCLIHTLPLFPSILPIGLSGTGSISIPASLPPGLPTLDVYLQAIFADPSSASGIAATNPLQMHIQ